jgi:hypothetical protein
MGIVHDSIIPSPELATDLVLPGRKRARSTGLFSPGHIVWCKRNGARSTTGMHHAGLSPLAFVPSAATRHVEVDVARSGRCCGASLHSSPSFFPILQWYAGALSKVGISIISPFLQPKKDFWGLWEIFVKTGQKSLERLKNFNCTVICSNTQSNFWKSPEQ